MYDKVIEGVISYSLQNETEFKHYGKGHLNGGHSGRYPWNSGKRPRQSEEKQLAALTKSVHNLAKRKEPIITDDIMAAANAAGSKMYGLEHRLKTAESIRRKIKTDAFEKEVSLEEAAKIKDAVRYTVMSDDNSFVRKYESVKRELESKGYVEDRCKNYFEMYREGKVKHKSVQSVFMDKEGYKFEVQFQTPASQNAKNLKIPIYEERRKPGLPREKQLELEQKMVDLAEAVPYPRGISKIKSH